MASEELVKLYYRIGEVSRIVGVQPHVLRYWETEFRSIRPQKSSRGQRVYSRRDVERLLEVKDLLRNQGFTIAGARKRLARGVGGPVEEGASSEEEAREVAALPVNPAPLAARAPERPVSTGIPPRTGGEAALVPEAGPGGLASTGSAASPVSRCDSPAAAECREPPVPLTLGDARREDRRGRSMRRGLLAVREEMLRFRESLESRTFGRLSLVDSAQAGRGAVASGEVGGARESRLVAGGLPPAARPSSAGSQGPPGEGAADGSARSGSSTGGGSVAAKPGRPMAP